MHPDNRGEKSTAVEFRVVPVEFAILSPPESPIVAPPVLVVFTASDGEAVTLVEELSIVAVGNKPSWVRFGDALTKESCKARRQMLNARLYR